MTSDQAINGPELSQDMVLEEALQVAAGSESKSANVVDRRNTIIGSITLDQIVEGLARPQVDNITEGQYR